MEIMVVLWYFKKYSFSSASIAASWGKTWKTFYYFLRVMCLPLTSLHIQLREAIIYKWRQYLMLPLQFLSSACSIESNLPMHQTKKMYCVLLCFSPFIPRVVLLPASALHPSWKQDHYSQSQETFSPESAGRVADYWQFIPNSVPQLRKRPILLQGVLNF